jgi:hypothetical protein
LALKGLFGAIGLKGYIRTFYDKNAIGNGAGAGPAGNGVGNDVIAGTGLAGVKRVPRHARTTKSTTGRRLTGESVEPVIITLHGVRYDKAGLLYGGGYKGNHQCINFHPGGIGKNGKCMVSSAAKPDDQGVWPNGTKAGAARLKNEAGGSWW